MHGWYDMGGWAWLWMTLVPLLWIAVLGLVVYLAVRLAQGDRGGRSGS
jgi:putative membrane protein